MNRGPGACIESPEAPAPEGENSCCVSCPARHLPVACAQVARWSHPWFAEAGNHRGSGPGLGLRMPGPQIQMRRSQPLFMCKFLKWLSDAACARPFRVRAPSLLHDVGTFQARRRAGPEDFAAAKGCSPPRATGSPKSCHHASPTIEQEHGQQRRRRHPSGAPTPARPGHAPSPRAWPPACPRHIPQSEEQNHGQQAREERQQKPKQAERSRSVESQ